VRFPTFGDVVYNGKTNVLRLTDQSVQPPFLGPANPVFPFLEVPIATCCAA
jgi:hypothetical protein